MGRPQREQIENGLYHVTIRGIRRGPIFLDEDDFARFLRLLARVVERREWEIHAYCLLTNHYHLLLTTPNADISHGMCLLNGHYGRTFNELHGFTGHVFERRFHATVIVTEEHLVVTSAYIALNPVAAGLADRPQAYRWSSYAATVNGANDVPFLSPARLLRQFADDPSPPREAYRRYVERRQADLALV
jgi:putative transposase